MENSQFLKKGQTLNGNRDRRQKIRLKIPERKLEKIEKINIAQVFFCKKYKLQISRL